MKPVAFRHSLVLLVTALLAAMIAWPAEGQQSVPSPRPIPAMPPPDDSPRDLRLVRIDVGPGDNGFRTGFLPVRVWLTSRVRSHNAVISVRTVQDSTQEAVVRLNVSTTPGVVTPHEVPVSINARAERVDVTIESDERPIRRSLGRISGVDDSLPPPTNDALNLMLVGEVPFAAATLSQPDPQQAATDKPEPGSPWRSVTISPTRPDELFLTWLTYDCVDAVIATTDALSKADPRAKQALFDWVEAGGSLLLVAEDAGSLWRTPWNQRDDLPLDLHEATTVTCPGTLVTRLRPWSFEPPVTVNENAPETFTVRSRTLSLTDRGRALGWTLHMPLEGDRGLLATGPFGAGRLGLVAIEPQRLAPTLSIDAAKTVYRHAVGELLPARRIKDLRWAGATGQAAMFNPFAQSAFESSQPAVTAILNADAANIPPVSPWSLAGIIGIAATLGLLVGPVDAFLVRRRSRRGATTWITAMGWIAGATVLAVALPLVMRSGRTTINSSESIDVLIDDPSRAGRQWSTTLIALFADGPIGGRLEGLPEGAWVRGVSANDSWWMEDDVSLPPLRIAVTTAAGGTPQASPDAIDQGQWTLRTLMARAPQSPTAIRAGVASGDRVAVRLEGLGSCKVDVQGILRSASGTFDVSFEEHGESVLAVVGKHVPATEPKAQTPSEWWQMDRPSEADLLASVPGFDRRTDSLLARVNRGLTPHVVLEGRFTADESPLSLEGVEESKTTRHHVKRVRVTFPVDERFIQSLTAIKSSPSTPPQESP